MRFESFLRAEFDVGELDRNEFSVMGCEIAQNSTKSVSLTQQLKHEEIDLTELKNLAKTHKNDDIAGPKEITAYRSIIGKMLFIGRMYQPAMLYHASHMATKIPQLFVHHLKDLASLVNNDKQHIPKLQFISTPAGQKFQLEAYSDAAMSNKKCNEGRNGFIIFRRWGDIVHPIYWNARKLRRVARSSTTAEILGAADATSMLLYLQTLLAEILYEHGTELVTDSRSTFKLTTSTKEPEEAFNKVDISAIRQAYNTNKLQTISWCPGYYLVADALTKDNRTSASLLLKVLREGKYARHPEMHRVH